METFTDTKKIASSEYVQSTQLMQKDLFNLIFLWPLVRVFIPSLCANQKDFLIDPCHADQASQMITAGIRICKCALSLTHLLVADDTLTILMKADDK